MNSELSRTAFHEAGHAVGISGSFRDARWLPKPPPVLAFAKAHCHADADLKLAEGVLADLRRLGAHDEQGLVDRTLALLQAYWPAVEGVAARLVESRRIEGDEIERIMDHSLSSSASA